MPPPRQFDVVVWGATGFTGSLVAEHLARDYPTGVKWALAGRSLERLQALRTRLAQQYGDAVERVPLLVGDLQDEASLDAIASQTRVLLSTAGPFALYGEPVAAAAVRCGCHYVDITGETAYVRRLIAKHHEEAAAKKLRIVPCCGFDSAPFDLGALLVSDHLKKRYGRRPARILSAMLGSKGGVSGGTVASMMVIAEEAARSPDPAAQTVLGLVPPEAAGSLPDWLEPCGEFWGVQPCQELGSGYHLAPFVMQFCNCSVVHRSNHLLRYDGSAPGGPVKLMYSEAVAAPSWFGAKLVQAATSAMSGALRRTWLHPLLKRLLPKQGQGPSREDMLGGFFKMKVLAWAAAEEATSKNSGNGSRKAGEPLVVQAEVGDAHRDAGYWGTSRMALEAALCLALQQKQLDASREVQQGGVLTPASAMGMLLIERLRAAGMTFQVLEAAGSAKPARAPAFLAAAGRSASGGGSEWDAIGHDDSALFASSKEWDVQQQAAITAAVLGMDSPRRGNAAALRGALALYSLAGAGHFMPLHLAVRAGQLESVLALLDAGGLDVDARDSSGLRPLDYACESSQAAIVEALLAAGADPNTAVAKPQPQPGVTPLVLSAQLGHASCVRALLKAGADANLTTGRAGSTALFMAAHNGHLECVEALIQEGAADVNAPTDGLTALTAAAASSHTDAVRALVAAGASLQHDRKPWMALCMSALEGNLEVLQLLLQAGADVDAVDEEQGWTAAHIAAEMGHEACLAALVESGCKLELRDKAQHFPLHLAAREGHEGCVRILLAAGANPNATMPVPHPGNTALMLAAAMGHAGCIRALIAGGADCNAVTTGESMSALYVAVMYSNLDCVTALIQDGKINLDVVSIRGHTPLALAALNGHNDILRVLLSAGASMKGSPSRWPALDLAASCGNLEAMRLLLEAGAAIDGIDPHGFTAAHTAAQNGEEAALAALIESGCDLNARSEENHVPLHLAAHYGHKGCVRLLLAAGADPLAKNWDGDTPRELARQERHVACERLLAAAEGGASASAN